MGQGGPAVRSYQWNESIISPIFKKRYEKPNVKLQENFHRFHRDINDLDEEGQPAGFSINIAKTNYTTYNIYDTTALQVPRKDLEYNSNFKYLSSRMHSSTTDSNAVPLQQKICILMVFVISISSCENRRVLSPFGKRKKTFFSPFPVKNGYVFHQ